MKAAGTVMLFIDADNVSTSVIDQAMAHVLAEEGGIHVRRAHCTAETALKHQQFFKGHSIRPIVNLSTGKNATDIALAVDAIDLVATERPRVVVIVSSDSDFAPLVIRLREKGCRVLGIGQLGKTGEDSRGVYDGFVDMAHQKARVPSKALAGRAPARAPAAAPAPASTSTAAPAPAPAPAAAPAPAPAAARPRARAQAVRARAPAAVAPAPALPPEVAAILHAFPALGNGVAMQLNEVGEAMRKHAILKSKSASPSGYLKRHKAHFELAPADKPRTVRYLGARLA
ncbi:MAG: NYN domain-containing protein [Bacteriovorax sp.]|nr:NYN domain-containing protein [Rhizobacter sp.]